MMKKVLIIEDDEDLREGLSFSFMGDGYEVLDVGTKKEGLKKLKKLMRRMMNFQTHMVGILLLLRLIKT